MHLVDCFPVFPGPYERRGRDGGELQVGDRFLIERSGFEGFGAVDRDRGHLVVGVDYVERQRGVELGRDVDREMIVEMFTQAEEVLNGATKWVK